MARKSRIEPVEISRKRPALPASHELRETRARETAGVSMAIGRLTVYNAILFS